jgi:hypothetical protein
MISQPVSLNSQLLTPERVCWVFDIASSTEQEWRNMSPPAIAFFRRGRVIRYTPEAVLQAIAAGTAKAAGNGAYGNGSHGFSAEAWVRIERLVELKVRELMK